MRRRRPKPKTTTVTTAAAYVDDYNVDEVDKVMSL